MPDDLESSLRRLIAIEREACASIAESAWLYLPYPDQYSADVAKLACRKAAEAIRSRPVLQ